MNCQQYVSSSINKFFFVAFFGLIGLWTRADAEHSIGGHGDPIRLLVAEARDDARVVLIRVKPEMLNADPTVVTWYQEHYEEYQQVMANLKPVWVEESTGACATAYPDRLEIVFSYTDCKRLDPTNGHSDIENKTDALKLLFHEAVHLLRQPDENFADAVALAIYDAWIRMDINTTPRWEDLSPDNRPSERTGFASAQIETKNFSGFFVWGGCNEERGSDQTPVGFACSNFLGDGGLFDSDKDEWTPVPPVPVSLLKFPNEGLRAFSSAVYRPSESDKLGDIYIYGGCSGSQFTCETDYNSILKFNLDEKSWQVIAPTENQVVPKARSKHSAFLTKNGMLIFGGVTDPRTPGRGRSLNDGWMFDFNLLTWKRTRDDNAPSPRRFGATVFTGYDNLDSSFNGNLIVFGGCDKESGELCTQYFNDGAVYNLELDLWTPLPNVSLSRRGNVKGAWGNGMFMVYGGRNATGGLPDGALLKLNSDVKTSKWTIVSDLSGLPRYAHSLTWAKDRFLVWGGLTKYNEYTANLSEYFLPNSSHPRGQWRSLLLTSSPVGRSDNLSLWSKKGLYIWGGISEDRSYLNTGGIFLPKVTP